MLVISALLGFSEFLILLYATRFWHFALMTFLSGVAQSARSGSESALLYDSLSLEPGGKANSKNTLAVSLRWSSGLRCLLRWPGV